ncbi:MAG: translation initiation factor IF-3 [bacterium]|nr:translation initiation factor IF-3 [bacterium]
MEKDTKVMVNRKIRAKEVRLISETGEQLGILSLDKAIEMAEERGLDLVEVAPAATPPVCKIMDYGKYKYQQHKRAQESKKHQKVIHIKEIKLRPKTEEHDFQFKKEHVRKFLLDGNKVKVTVVFRGREMTHFEIGEELLNRMAKEVEGEGLIEQPPKKEGRNMTLLLVAKNHGQRKEKPKKEGLEDAKGQN